jgi:hypothetical protein
LVLVAVGVTAFYLGFNHSEIVKTETSPIATSSASVSILTVIPSSSPLPISSEWKTYVLSTIPLSLQLPPKLTTLGPWHETVVNGNTGKKLCFELNEEPKSRGSVGSCYFGSFLISAVSSDFSAGRGSDFSDIKGVIQEKNNRIYLVEKDKEYLLPSESVKKQINPYGVEIYIVKSLPDEQGYSPHGLPDAGLFNDNSFGDPIGAYINTDTSYGLLKIQMMNTNNFFDSAINENDFNQILQTIKFTN